MIRGFKRRGHWLRRWAKSGDRTWHFSARPPFILERSWFKRWAKSGARVRTRARPHTRAQARTHAYAQASPDGLHDPHGTHCLYTQEGEALVSGKHTSTRYPQTVPEGFTVNRLGFVRLAQTGRPSASHEINDVGAHARPCRHACTDVSCLVDVACVCVRACFCANVSACGRVCLKARNVLRGMPQHVPRSVQHARGMPRHVTRSTYASRCDLLARCRGRRRWTEHCDKRGINNDDCASASTSTVREPDSANRRTSR